MARSFSGSGQYLHYSTTEAGPANFTVAAWINPTSVTGVRGIIERDNSVDALRHFQFRTNGTALELIVFVANSAHTASKSTVSTNSWQHVCGTYDGETVRVYLNGGTAGTNTAPSGNADNDLVPTTIGARYSGGSFLDPFAGAIAEAAYWNTALNDDEVAALAAKYSPLLIRPTAHLSYWPLLGRATNEEDWADARPMTTTGATVSDHPPIFLPRYRTLIHIAAAGTTDGAGASDSTTTVVGVGASTAAAAGASAATATVAGVGAATAAATGAADAVATVAGVGAAIASGVGASAAVATVAGVGASTAAATGAAASVATVAGVGASTAAAVGSSTATSSGEGTGSDGGNAGAGAANASVSGVGAATAAAVGQASASASAEGVGADASAAAAPSASAPAGVRRRKRVYVEIDDQLFEVSNEREARELLTKAQATAREVVKQVRANPEAPKVSIPIVTVRSEEKNERLEAIAAQAQTYIAQQYKKAQAIQRAREEDEDDVEMLLLSL